MLFRTAEVTTTTICPLKSRQVIETYSHAHRCNQSLVWHITEKFLEYKEFVQFFLHIFKVFEAISSSPFKELGLCFLLNYISVCCISICFFFMFFRKCYHFFVHLSIYFLLCQLLRS